MDLPPGGALRGDDPVTNPGAADPHLALLQRFPIKALDPERCGTATLVADGALAGDRRWAIVDRPPGEPYDPATADVGGAGDFVNGKKTAQVHRLRSRFVPDAGESGPDGAGDTGPAVDLRRQGEGPGDWRRFDLFDGGQDRAEATVHDPLNDWLRAFFDRPVSVRRTETGQHDDRERHGPTVVSTAALREVGAWFEFDLASARRRFRANLEIGGVPPFWEDSLFGDHGEVVRFQVGKATLQGVHPCARCVVPGRDPDTGTETPGFRETFTRRRRETMPSWTASNRFDHTFRLMVNTRVPEQSVGRSVSVGEPVELVGTRD
ncbi:MAG: MOSC N-terminal beta barrel domain-containing protein [Haloarculaceae archaeon]